MIAFTKHDQQRKWHREVQRNKKIDEIRKTMSNRGRLYAKLLTRQAEWAIVLTFRNHFDILRGTKRVNAKLRKWQERQARLLGCAA